MGSNPTPSTIPADCMLWRDILRHGYANAADTARHGKVELTIRFRLHSVNQTTTVTERSAFEMIERRTYVLKGVDLVDHAESAERPCAFKVFRGP